MKKLYVDSDIEEIIANIQPLHENFEGKSILITGAGGFLGRYFTAVFQKLNESVLQHECRVTALDNFISENNPSYEEGKRSGVNFLQHDVIQPFETDESFDYILHAAGIASPFYYRAFPLETIEVSITGTKNMLQHAMQAKANLLFFSSSEIYGDPDPKYIPTAESYRGNVSCLGARACYDESKRLGETLCRVFHTEHGVHTNIVRPFNVYGPGMGERDYRVLPNFASRIKGGHPLHIYSSGEQTRTFCYVTDAIAGFLKILVNGVPGEPYNMGNPRPEISMIGVAELIKEILDIKLHVDTVDYPDSYPADEPNRRCPDISKARAQLNYEPKVELEDGLLRFLNWTDQHYTGVLD